MDNKWKTLNKIDNADIVIMSHDLINEPILVQKYFEVIMEKEYTYELGTDAQSSKHIIYLWEKK